MSADACGCRKPSSDASSGPHRSGRPARMLAQTCRPDRQARRSFSGHGEEGVKAAPLRPELLSWSCGHVHERGGVAMTASEAIAARLRSHGWLPCRRASVAVHPHKARCTVTQS
jgi:hypothetical protein